MHVLKFEILPCLRLNEDENATLDHLPQNREVECLFPLMCSVSSSKEGQKGTTDNGCSSRPKAVEGGWKSSESVGMESAGCEALSGLRNRQKSLSRAQM